CPFGRVPPLTVRERKWYDAIKYFVDKRQQAEVRRSPALRERRRSAFAVPSSTFASPERLRPDKGRRRRWNSWRDFAKRGSPSTTCCWCRRIPRCYRTKWTPPLG